VQPSELATELGVPVGEVIDALGARESQHSVPLDRPYGEDGDVPFLDPPA
jgi:RNA polymerase sigma-B factor